MNVNHDQYQNRCRLMEVILPKVLDHVPVRNLDPYNLGKETLKMLRKNHGRSHDQDQDLRVDPFHKHQVVVVVVAEVAVIHDRHLVRHRGQDRDQGNQGLVQEDPIRVRDQFPDHDPVLGQNRNLDPEHDRVVLPGLVADPEQ